MNVIRECFSDAFSAFLRDYAESIEKTRGFVSILTSNRSCTYQRKQEKLSYDQKKWAWCHFELNRSLVTLEHSAPQHASSARCLRYHTINPQSTSSRCNRITVIIPIVKPSPQACSQGLRTRLPTRKRRVRVPSFTPDEHPYSNLR